ncbi:protein kinase [Theileria orientalis]|uniref:Protein kinase n=1 Tax=Theileria orientalis TaxID=68886 RepID=A0A976ME80_THEOR|nr:protein kinase [Theileria orientalis]
MHQGLNSEGINTHLREFRFTDEKSEGDNKPSSTTSRHDSENRFLDKATIDALRNPGKKRIRRLSAGSKLSNYYYIGAELRICADCVKKPSSRPLLRDIIDRKTGEPKILKIISKSRIPPGLDSLNNWRTLCEKLLNMPPMPNLMRIDQIWESDTSFYIVTEKFIGGELFEYLLKEKAIPEDICKYIFRQILQAVDTLHTMNLLHRDIKPENIMFRNPTKSVLPVAERYELALIDFDTCKMTDCPTADKSEIVNGKRRLVGTYGYLAPEILRGDDYSTASDMWSIGIVLYILMTGIPPVSMDKMYDAKASHAVLAAAEANGIDFNTPPLVEFPLARDLCKRLLCFDKRKRISSAADALAHPWLAGLPNIFDLSLRLRNSQDGSNPNNRRSFKNPNNGNQGGGSGNGYGNGSGDNNSRQTYGENHNYRNNCGVNRQNCITTDYAIDASEFGEKRSNESDSNKRDRDLDDMVYDDKTVSRKNQEILQSLTTNAESIDGTYRRQMKRRAKEYPQIC